MLTLVPTYAQCWASVQEALDSPGAPLVHHWADWYRGSFANSLHEARRCLQRHEVRLYRVKDCAKDHKHVQNVLYEQIRKPVHQKRFQ